MCIYPMESPGGYQLIGRTLPIWNSFGRVAPFTPDKPWLLRIFDQVRTEISSSFLAAFQIPWRALVATSSLAGRCQFGTALVEWHPSHPTSPGYYVSLIRSDTEVLLSS